MSAAAEGVVVSGERRNLLARVRGAAPAGTWPVVAPVIAAAAVVVGFAFWEGVNTLAGPALMLLVAATLAEAFPVPIENVRSGETSFANVFIVTAAVIYGWETAVIVGVLAMLLVEVYTHKPPVRMLYNASIYALAALAAGLVAEAVPEQYRTGLAQRARVLRGRHRPARRGSRALRGSRATRPSSGRSTSRRSSPSR